MRMLKRSVISVGACVMMLGMLFVSTAWAETHHLVYDDYDQLWRCMGTAVNCEKET
jgi:hypothetical protein